MLMGMTKANTWVALGTLTNRIACRLKSVREARIEGVATPQDIATRLPGREISGDEGRRDRGFENGLRAGDRDEARMKGVGPAADIGESRRADAGRVRTSAMHASREIRDAARLPQGEVGQQAAAPRAGRLPLFHSGE